MQPAFKFIILISFFTLLHVKSIGQGHYYWATESGSITRNGGGEDITIDSEGNSYVVGNFYDQAVFGNDNLSALGNDDIFISKYNSAGKILWTRQAGGKEKSWDNRDLGLGICLDLSGNIYITGYFSGTASFGKDSIVSASGGKSFFIAKYDNEGNYQWVRSAIGGTFHTGKTITTDYLGNIYVAGDYAGNMKLASTNFSERGIFLAKYDPLGNVIWAQDIPNGYIPGKLISNETGIYFTGSFQSRTNIGIYNLSAVNFSDVFIAKFSFNGWCSWAKKGGGKDVDLGLGIALDKEGNIFITGQFWGTSTFDSETIVSSTGHEQFDYEIFVAKYNNYGNIQWIRSYGNMGDEEGVDIAINAKQEIYLLGEFKGAIFMGKSLLTSGNSGNTFLAKLNQYGNVTWAKLIEGNAKSLSLDENNDIYITGRVSGRPVYMDRIKLDQYLAFTAKHSNPTNIISGKIFHDLNNDGLLSPGEPGIKNQIIKCEPNLSYAVTDSNGNYSFATDTGLYNITLLIPDNWEKTTYKNYESLKIKMAYENQESTNINLGIKEFSNINDLRVSLTGFVPRIGNPVKYIIGYENMGSKEVDGTIIMELDPKIQFDSCSIDYDVKVNNRFTWNKKSIPSNEKKLIELYCTIPFDTNLIGQQIKNSVSISSFMPEILEDNNYDSLKQNIEFFSNQDFPFHSYYNPNDKISKPITEGNYYEEPIPVETKSITYTIRFQNVRKDTLSNVVISDKIDENLNIESIKTLSSSHDYSFKIINTNIAVWEFDNIQLFDSTSSKLNSQGYVTYQINLKDNLAEGSKIQNTAHTYFDFNNPRQTNTQRHILRNIGITHIKNIQEKVWVKVFPNSGTESISITTDHDQRTQFSIYNLEGKIILQDNLYKENKVSLNNIPKGIYIIRINNSNGELIDSQKLIIN